MRTVISLTVGLVLIAAAPAQASFHLWDFSEVYSNADGSVQFIELFTTSNFERFTSGHTITSGNKSFVFPDNTPASTADHHLLLATPGFADLDGGVAPDFELPVNFFDPSGDTLTFVGLIDPSVTFNNLPTDGVDSLHYPDPFDFLNNGVSGVNSPTNYLGISGSIIPTPVLLSDLNNNGFVDFEDLTVLLANWNKNVTVDDGNLVDPDGSPVNFADLTVLLADWTGPGPAGAPPEAAGAAAIPEPSAIMLAAFAALGVAAFRRRRRDSVVPPR
ncbi:MAG: PEP-CTERM sorting domain-containing protein [Planctomycetes bacterium]|nr:PEP-CTERM sorting domain-containing protein [Planctomycetota bacterium]